MNQYVGLDVSLEQTSICVVDEDGKALWQGKCASTPEMLVAVMRARAPQAARIGLESGPLSLWHWHALRQAGLPVVCLDARHAKAALSLQLNKSDANEDRKSTRLNSSHANISYAVLCLKKQRDSLHKLSSSKNS